MKVLIILSKDEKGKKVVTEENHTSWREAIERSPVGEFVVKGDPYFDYLFSFKLKYLCCKVYLHGEGLISTYKNKEAEERFDYLLERKERLNSL